MEKKDITVIVSGLTRCGSSLTMQMLHAGGMPISCAPGNEAVSGEHDSQTEALKILALGQAGGMAIKCLDPHRFLIPPNGNYIFLWCHRDFKEQAKSICKFSKALGIPINRNALKVIEKSLLPDTKDCLVKLKKLGPVHKFLFEDTIIDPMIASTAIAFILKDVITLDVAKMAAVVIDRNTGCYDGFLETALIERGIDSTLKPV